MARVLFVGGEDHRLRIPFLLAMRGRGFAVEAAGSGDPAPFLSAGIPFHPWPFDRFLSPASDWRALGRLADLLRERRPDLAQGYDTKPCIYLPLAAARTGTGTRVVRTICGEGWVGASDRPLARLLRPVQRALHGLAARAADATVFETEADARSFAARGMAGRRALVIPAGGGGIDVAGFEAALAAAPGRAATRRALGLADDAPVVVTVTRVTRQKGVPALLRAARLAHARSPGLRVLLVGPLESEGPLAVPRAEIEAAAPVVAALGARDDVPALLRAADVFAFPTEYREGVPRVLLEATLAGLPVVSTAMPGCREVIADGESGLLVPPGDAEAMAAAMLRLLGDPALGRSLQARAETVVRGRFALSLIADRHAELYRDLLGGTARACHFPRSTTTGLPPLPNCGERSPP